MPYCSTRAGGADRLQGPAISLSAVDGARNAAAANVVGESGRLGAIILPVSLAHFRLPLLWSKVGFCVGDTHQDHLQYPRCVAHVFVTEVLED